MRIVKEGRAPPPPEPKTDLGKATRWIDEYVCERCSTVVELDVWDTLYSMVRKQVFFDCPICHSFEYIEVPGYITSCHQKGYVFIRHPGEIDRIIVPGGLCPQDGNYGRLL